MTHFTGKASKYLLLSAVVTLLLTAYAFAADLPVAVGATTGSSLRMRSDASASSDVVSMLDKSVAVAVLDTSVESWYKISYAGNVGYVSSDYVILDQDNVFTACGRANADGVNVREQASADSKSLATVDAGTVVTVNGFQDGWYNVTCKYGTQGYIRGDFIDLTSAEDSGAAASGADLARQYLGVRYVYGGSSPSGFDCSGFTMYLYQQLGYALPHTATGQWKSGIGTQVYSISALQRGDLVFFNDPSRNAGKACSHAGIYIGDGQFIHASSAKYGVVTSSLTSGYYNDYFVGGIHV